MYFFNFHSIIYISQVELNQLFYLIYLFDKFFI